MCQGYQGGEIKKMAVRDTEIVSAFVDRMAEGMIYFSKGRIPKQKIQDMAAFEVSKLDFNNEWQMHKGIGYFAMQAVNRYFDSGLDKNLLKGEIMSGK